MLNASLADILVPMSVEMPDVQVTHIDTPNTGRVHGVA